MKPQKVIIIDDETIIRESLSDWFSPDYETSSFDSGETFLNAYNNNNLDDGRPTCVLLDFQLSGMNGVELLNALSAINKSFAIIFMSGNAQQVDIINAWHGGAVDFILKPFRADQISDVLAIQFERLKKIKNNIKPLNKSEADAVIPITKREAQVLLLLSKGHTQNEVAKNLCISLRTVKMYRTFIKNKLRLETLAEIVHFCDLHSEAISHIAKHTAIDV